MVSDTRIIGAKTDHHIPTPLDLSTDSIGSRRKFVVGSHCDDLHDHRLRTGQPHPGGKEILLQRWLHPLKNQAACGRKQHGSGCPNEKACV